MKYHFLYNDTRGMAIILRMIAMFLFFSIVGCKEKKEWVDFIFDKEFSYTMKDTEVQVFISDSGITRFRMTAKALLTFDEASEPYWYFPEKIHGEMLDSLLQVAYSVDADTAYRYTKKMLWKLIGNVKAVNAEGEQFETSLLFWDENEEKIYSDQFIRITRGDFVNTGTGFESNQTLTKYYILNAKAEIPVQENTPIDTTTIDYTPLP